MALGGRTQAFLTLSRPLPITARLLAAAFLAWLAGPIPLARPPPRPETGRGRTGWTTVPRQGMRRRKPLLTSLQEANPCTSTDRYLWRRWRAIMLEMDQGSANSPRSSPGSGASKLLRSGAFLDCSFLPVQPQSSVITPPPLFQPDWLLAPSFTATAARADWPPHPAKLAPSFAATDSSEPEPRQGVGAAAQRAGFVAMAVVVY